MSEAGIIEETADRREFAITLIPSPDDPPKHDKEYQTELRTLAKEMHAQGVDFSSRAVLMESASGGGFSLGEFYAVARKSKQKGSCTKFSPTDFIAEVLSGTPPTRKVFIPIYPVTLPTVPKRDLALGGWSLRERVVQWVCDKVPPQSSRAVFH